MCDILSQLETPFSLVQQLTECDTDLLGLAELARYKHRFVIVGPCSK